MFYPYVLAAVADLAAVAAIGLTLAAFVSILARPGREQSELNARRSARRQAAVIRRARVATGRALVRA